MAENMGWYGMPSTAEICREITKRGSEGFVASCRELLEIGRNGERERGKKRELERERGFVSESERELCALRPKCFSGNSSPPPLLPLQKKQHHHQEIRSVTRNFFLPDTPVETAIAPR